MLKVFTPFVALFATLSLSAQTFSSTVNQPIPDDGSTVTFDIPVSGLPGVIDTFFGLETVCLNMTHTYTEDMTVKLQAPNGKVVMLFGGVGGGGHNFYNTCLEGTGSSMATSAAPFSGTFQSMGILGNINKGQDPNGTWTLILHDTYPFADEGFLIDWSITFGNNPAKPFVYTSSNLPIVKFTTLNDPIGDEPKVPVRMQIIDNGAGQRNYPDQTNYAYEGLIMVEWQGFTGPYYPKKNYDFELVDNQLNDLDTSILGLPTESDFIFKAEYLDHSLVKNSVTYEMARRMGGYAPRTRPCEIVLDDEYIGMYVLTEKVKRDKNRIDIARLSPEDISGDALTGGYIFEMNINNTPSDWSSPYLPINYSTSQKLVEFKHVYPKNEDLAPEQRDYLRTYVDTFENALLAPDFADPEAGYRKYLDINTFIDFLIVNEFSVNYDSYGRSTYLYKEKVTDGGKLKIGPPWDYDRAMDYYNPATSSGWVWELTHPYWPFPFWWSQLWQDPAYRKQLACRWTMLRQNTLSTAAFTGLIDSIVANIDEAQERNFKVWNDLGAWTYDQNVDSLKSYVSRRLQWIDNTLAQQQVAAPVLPLSIDTSLCAGVLFDAAPVFGQQYTYNWQPGPDTSTITFKENGSYTLKVSDIYGCFAKTTLEVSVIPVIDAGFNVQQQAGSSTWAFQANDPNGSAYHWDFGDGSTSTLTNPVHQYAALGDYTVTLTVLDTHGCPEQTHQETVHFLTSGVAEPGGFGALVYPNPFDQRLQVTLPVADQEPVLLVLENQLGQQVLQTACPDNATSVILNTSQIPAGVYMLKMLKNGQSWSTKVVRL